MKDRSIDRSQMKQALAAAIESAAPLLTRISSRTASAQPEDAAEAFRVQAIIKRRNECFPSSAGQLRSAPRDAFGNTVQAELQRAVDLILDHSRDLNLLLQLKRDFENALLAKSFSEAEAILTNIRSVFGISIWHYEASILLAEQTGGFESIRAEAIRFTKAAKDNPTYGFFAYWIMRRAEPASSAASFSAAIGDMLNYISQHEDENVRATVDYVRSRLDMSHLQSIDNVATLLWRESQFPLIDYYLAVIRALQLLVGRGQDGERQAAAVNALRHLSQSLSDHRLNVLLSIGSPDSLPPDSVDHSFITALDLYTAGRYAECADACEELLKLSSAALEPYELHVKALINGRLHYRSPFTLATRASEIHRRVFEIVKKDDSTPEALKWLRKQSFLLDGMTIGPQLSAFCGSQSSSDFVLPSETFVGVTGTIVTPRLSALCAKASGKRLLDVIDANGGPHLSVELFRAVHGDRPLAGLPIPPLHHHKYSAILLEQRGEFAEAASIYRTMGEVSAGDTTYQEDAAVGLFRCLARLGDLGEAVKHSVNTYFRRKWLLLSVRLADLIKLLKNDPSRPKDQLDWPILFYIYFKESQPGGDLYPIFVAYDEFLRSHGLNKPSQLASLSPGLERAKLVTFLRDICTKNIMDNSVTAFRSSSQLDEERVAICQLLLALGVDGAMAVEREIVELTTGSAIRRAVKDVSERRVHVDVGGIKQSIGPQFREKFDRYIAHATLQDEQLRRTFASQGIPLNPGQRLVLLDVEDEATRLFKELFAALLSSFLFSRDLGLNFFLSVRIRHGWIKNHLRKTFSSHHLVTTSDKGVYGKNEFWREQFASLGEEVADAIDAHLQEFSKGVDDVIESFKSRAVQIKSRNNEDGLLNYEFGEKQLVSMHLQVQHRRLFDFEEFIDSVFEVLWHRTEDQLRYVRMHIVGPLKNQLISLIETLETKVFAALPGRRHAQMSTALTACRTDLQREIDVIAAWFHIADRTDVPDYSAGLVVNTGIEIIRKLHPTRLIDVISDVKTQRQCSGETFIPMLDMLQIMLENVVQHTSGSTIAARVELFERESFLRLQVTNSLPSTIDLEGLQQMLDARRQDAIEQGKAFETSVSSETGSGYFKLYSLLRSPAFRRNAFDFKFAVTSDFEFVAWVELSIAGVRA